MDKHEEKKDRLVRDYERPEDRIPHEGEGMDTEPAEPRAASNQQHDMGSADGPATQGPSRDATGEP